MHDPTSYYRATATPFPAQPRLEGETRADVAIVGAGYTGLSAALHLARAGYRVVVLEAEQVGFGASGRNGGQLSGGQRRDVDWLEAKVGRERARALWALGDEAPTHFLGDDVDADAGRRAHRPREHQCGEPHGAQADDGDRVVLRGWCEKPGAARIGFGHCAATILPALSSSA